MGESHEYGSLYRGVLYQRRPTHLWRFHLLSYMNIFYILPSIWFPYNISFLYNINLIKIYQQRKMSLSHDGICLWFLVRTKFELSSFPYFSPRNINHVSKLWVSTLFRVRKLSVSTKFEEKLYSRQIDSNFVLTQGFRTRKSVLTQSFDTWLIFQGEK